MGSETPVLILLQTVFNSILQVFLVCLAGFVLAHFGILDKKTQKQLNHINVSLFTPALLFSKVAFFLTPSKLRELWIVPIFFVVVTSVSMLTAQILSRALRLKPSQRAFATAASMFMNSNSLPIALMQSLVLTVPHLKWGAHDKKDAMVGRALTYLVMYSTLGMVLRWSYGVRLLSQADDEVTPEDSSSPQISEPTDQEQATERSPLLTKRSPSPTKHTDLVVVSVVSSPVHEQAPPLSSTQISQPSKPTQTLRPHPQRKRTFYNSFPNTPNASRTSIHMPPVFTAVDSERSSLNEGDSSSSLDSSESSEDEGDIDNNRAVASSSSTSISGKRQGARRSQSELTDDSLTVAGDSPADDEQQSISKSAQKSPDSQPENSPQERHHHHHHRHHREHEEHPLTLKRFFRNLGRWITQLVISINSFMTVPLYAAILSLIVACIPPLQHYLMVHAWPVKGALEQLGSVSIPMTLVVLGAYFYVPSADLTTTEVDDRTLLRKAKDAISPADFFSNLRKAFSSSTSDSSPRNGETKTVVVAIFSRMVLTPIIILPLMVVSAVWDIQKVFSDPVFVVSNTLLISSPPALTLAQITQAASGDAFERLISKTIFWSYCIVTPPITILYVVIGLVLSKL